MTESLCSCCQLLGKPPSRVNFIITTGVPDSLIYQRIKHLLRNYSASPSSANDVHLTNYQTLMNISDQLFTRQNHVSAVAHLLSPQTHTCCHGFATMPIESADVSDPTDLERLRRDIHDLLDPKTDSETNEQNATSKTASWIMLVGSSCLKPALLDIFLHLKDRHTLPSSSFDFTMTILCFLVDEQRLFENWLYQSLSIQDYQAETYPEYDGLVRDFFPLLNSSQYLQHDTLLIKEQTVLTDNELQTLLKSLFHPGSSAYRANNHQLRHAMAKLLSPRQRTVHDIRSVRNNLQGRYHRVIEDRLQPLLSNLQQPSTKADAARQIVNIVLNEFGRMNDEELRVYKRLFLLGDKSYDNKHSDTIASQLVHYALHLLNDGNNSSTPLVYSIVLVICALGSHFFFRHQLFNNTPEIYTLSLLLVNQRQYALTLSGLRLCTTILNGDQNEHKYAMTYLTHDHLTARKILDTIRWLLSPYQTLDKLWKEEEEEKEEKEGETSESEREQTALYNAERFCFRHASILLERSYIRSVASLFYGSADHCAQVTEDDIHNLVEVIDVLADPRIATRSRGENRSRCSLMLIGHICALLTPILQHSLPSVSLALQRSRHLLTTIPKAIRGLLETDEIDETMVNTCARFYARVVQLKCKQEKSDNYDKQDQQETDSSISSKDAPPPTSSNSLALSNDLISSYFDLHRSIHKSSLLEERSAQEKQLKELSDEEWKKLDILQLQQHHQHLQHEHTSVKDELSQLRNELQRTQSERDQFRKENINMAQEIDNLKRMPISNIIEQSPQSSVLVSTHDNNQKSIIDELQNLPSHEITTEQAEQCIREIHHRRTTFSDHDMRKSICGSLKHLGSDLYSSSVHFLHELIQNAEDNFYDDNLVPCLRIELNHSYILLSNNEQGLRTRDVLALCSLAVSTKSVQQQHIGEKGVGFKSVFAATNQPMLISRAWTFSFHVPGVDAMSYITPLWIKDQDIPDCISKHTSTGVQHTHLYLPLKYAAHTSEADLFLNQVTTAADPCILLNMRQLQKLEIIDQRQNKFTIIEKQLIGPAKLEQQSHVTFEDFSFINLTGSLIRLCTSPGYHTFRVYTCYIDVPNSIEQRRTPKTRLIMAFPCEDDYSLTSTVYTGLPVCDLGFNFLFNAEFHLVTSRENVRENVPLNVFIRDHLAALFVYLLLNDIDLRKDINRYCPSSNTHQVKHSSWWLVMIDSINQLITKYLPILFDIRSGKTIRHVNEELALLVSNEQLYNCGDIQVINSDDGFLTSERLKSFQIQSVSIMDVLSCFPNREETIATNEVRQQFRLWTHEQNEQWWSRLFHHINQTMTSDLSERMLQKPLYLLHKNHPREYLPQNNNTRLLLFITDDPSLPMWKRQLLLLHYSSTAERSALLKSDHVQLLTDERMIEIIRHDHLQLAVSSSTINADSKLIEEVWHDLAYLKSRLDKLNRSIPFLVPVNDTTNLVPIQNAILPTILGVDIRSFMYSATMPIILYPYHNSHHHHHQLINNLEWEHFLLEMNCQRPSISFPSDYTIKQLPLLPSLTKFEDQKSARLGELIVSAQTQNTKQCLRQLPIVDSSQVEQQISPVSATFDKTIVRDLPSLPCITIPSYCRTLAIDLGICVEYDLRTCVTILQLLSDEKNRYIDLYVQWLGHLQLYVRQHDQLNLEDLLASCHLYLPDQNEFYSLKQLLVISDNQKYHTGILSISKYLKLQLISPSINQIYWQFKDLFRQLKCTCEVNIDHIYRTIYVASQDKSNFFALGDCATTLTEHGMETMITLFQYFEDLILKCVKRNKQNTALYHAIVENKHQTASCGSREDFEWRFGFTCNSISQQLRQLIDVQSQQDRIGLLTIDRQMIRKETDNIIYACLETKVIQNLARHIGKRHYISPVIARTCPLVLATFEIDYVERRAKLQWIHKNHNLEFVLKQLSDTFRNTLNDRRIEVITAKYASVSLLLSDSFLIDSTNEENENELDKYRIDSDYPFWIFDKTILLCPGYEARDSSKAIIATSALATLLHKRKHLSFDEATSIARQTISTCTAFRSEHIASVASAESTIYSFIDILFPTDHHSIESMIISIGTHCITERDLEDTTQSTVAADRSAIDRVYRNVVQTQHHIPHYESSANTWKDPSIVDGIEQITIGRNAEHFFFTYLQKCYGSIDVTPTKNWRSSARLVNHPECRREVDDAAGYDFELHDTREIFVRGHGSASTTKYCYFEVKGTSGLFHRAHTRFHITENELKICEGIAYDAGREQREAYFIVIIQNCLDAEKISFGTTVNWSNYFSGIQGTPDSYQCRIVSPQSTNPSDSRVDDSGNDHRPQQQPRQPNRSDGRNNNSTTQSALTNSGASGSGQYEPSPHDNQQQPVQSQQPNRSVGRSNNSTTQSTPTNSGASGSGQYEPSPHDNQQQPVHSQQPNRSVGRSNNSTTQSAPTNGGASGSGQYEPSSQQQQRRPPRNRGGCNNTYNQHSDKRK